MLVRDYPCYYIPPISKKSHGKQFDNNFVRKRMETLNLFLNQMCSCPEIKASKIFFAFLKVEHSQFKKVKTNIEKQVFSYSVHYSLFNPLKEPKSKLQTKNGKAAYCD